MASGESRNTAASYAFPPSTLRPILDEIATSLISRGATISVAETSTGGLISAALLSVPGASKYFVGGTTVYTQTSRRAWAGWDEETAKNYRGPSTEVVAGLATSVREQLQTTYCIGESGTAGPTVPTRPGFTQFVVGRTYLSFVSEEGVANRIEHTESTDRGYNMVAFAEKALILVRDALAAREEKFEKTN